MLASHAKFTLCCLALGALSACNGHILSNALTGGSVHQVDDKIARAYREFDSHQWTAAAHDCASAHGNLIGKIANSQISRSDSNVRETLGHLATCAADSNHMLSNRAEACRWYERADYQSMQDNFDPRRYCRD